MDRKARVKQDASGGGSRYAVLDLLRTIAAFAVVFYHLGFLGWHDGWMHVSFPELGPVARYGYLGVELFFIISGYVISMSLMGRDLRTFAILRAIRIYPTFWFCIAVTALLVHMLPGGGTLQVRGPADVLANALMLNVPLGIPYVDTVYWSLAVELQFYFVAAVARLVGGDARFASGLLGWLVAGSLVQVCSYVLFHGWRPPFPGEEYIGYFCVGSALYLIQHNRSSPSVIALLVFGVFAACGQAYVYAGVLSAHFHDPIARPIAVTIALLSIAAVAAAPFFRLPIRLTAVATFAGGITYPLYCLHQYVSYALINTFASRGVRWWALGLDVLAIALLASCIYIVFDRPVRRWLVASLLGPPKSV